MAELKNRIMRGIFVSDLRVGPLVRAIQPDSVAIWTEWSQSCEVTLTAKLAVQGQHTETLSNCVHTVTVGGRHYALSQFTGLQVAHWYDYQVQTDEQGKVPGANTPEILQCFRTLDVPESRATLRLAYGSCRHLSVEGSDALSALGPWLLQHRDERETCWPHLLLLIGDQIYADDPGKAGASREPAQTFEEFARLYEQAWTADAGVRQVLALLPTHTIFDDHEIINDWNITPTWHAEMLRKGQEQMLVDGLVAYWIYQGWGNIGLQDAHKHSLLAIMQQATQNGQDALEYLRNAIRQALYQRTRLQWHYCIPTTPPIFVTDLRTDRAIASDKIDPVDVVPRIMSLAQMEALQGWLRIHANSTVLLACSVPAILPPLIGLAEYTMGLRPFQHARTRFLRCLGHKLAGIQQKIAISLSFDHWPAFGATWRELVALLDTRQRDVIILSGDVHFSYAMSAHRRFWRKKQQATLYQFVASPFKNILEQRDERLVLGQTWLKRADFGGLHARVLPMHEPETESNKRIPHDILFQNVVALVTCQSHANESGKYDIQQVYLGVVQEKLERVGVTAMPTR